MKISKEIKIGIYFSIMLVALVWGINFLKGMDIFGKVNKLYAIYENVEGLQTTSNVSIKGMKVGSVSKIKLDQNNKKFIVELQINSGYNIPSNSVAYIYSSDIMGSKAIKIKIGSSEKMLNDGDKISSAMENDMFSLLMDDLPSIKDSLKRTLKEVDITFKGINKLLSDENIENLSKSIASLEHTMRNLSSLSSALNSSKSSLISSFENIDSITSNLKDNGANINNIIGNFSALSDSLKTFQLAQITQTVEELKTVLNKINSGTGSAGKLIYNDSVYNNLSNSLNNLDALLYDIKEHPKRYINISIFGGKSKK
ncbi:MAG: MlaD family protein [Prevotellaceae bacterium]|jgi:phospholipid/cholesterol/gamma-HCH transport system substrate-binding protein|nr:MlaD family protein [Prevotellaceae bacterium]